LGRLIRQVDALISVGLLALLVTGALSVAKESATNWKQAQDTQFALQKALQASAMLHLLPLIRNQAYLGGEENQSCVTFEVGQTILAQPLFNFSFMIHGKVMEVDVFCDAG
jgi:hypothetical protein